MADASDRQEPAHVRDAVAHRLARDAQLRRQVALRARTYARIVRERGL